MTDNRETKGHLNWGLWERRKARMTAEADARRSDYQEHYKGDKLYPGLQILAKSRLRKRNFFQKKMRSESKANTKFFSVKRSEANPFRLAIFRNKAKNFTCLEDFFIRRSKFSY